MWGMATASAPQRQKQETEEFTISLGYIDFQPRLGYKRLCLKATTTSTVIIIVRAGN